MIRLLLFIIFLFSSVQTLAEPQYFFSILNAPKYNKDFKNFDYVNPNAPKKGKLSLSALGSFDTLNPFTLKGIPPAHILLIHDSLFKETYDEPDTLYPLIAEYLELFPTDKKVLFRLNKNARFSNGSTIKTEDVFFSFETLKNHGSPMYQYYLNQIKKVELQDNLTIVFTFKEWNLSLIPIIAGMPILKKDYWITKNFQENSYDIPISSGPYIIHDLDFGKSITYKRLPEYWAKDLNVNKGFYNFDLIQIDYFRDVSVALEGFKSHAYDIRFENEARRWTYAKKYKPVKEGKIKQVEFSHGLPSGMQGFVFNLRKPIFQNILVRQAISALFDFDWTNKHLFNGLYTRTTSFFDNSFLKAPYLPTKEEKNILKTYCPNLDKEILTHPFQLPSFSNTREALAFSINKFEQAGWHINNGVLTKNNIPFEFEILIDAASAGTWERVILPFKDRLEHIGIKVYIRSLDLTQYEKRISDFDYDMIVSVWPQSLTPGSEQISYWHSSSSIKNSSKNYAGIQNPCIDALINKLIQAKNMQELIPITQALDRVLLWGHYVLPHWYTEKQRYLIWENINYPKKTPLKGTSFIFWWKKN